jgi:hypothetical protein
VIPFYGLASELEDLARWCRDVETTLEAVQQFEERLRVVRRRLDAVHENVVRIVRRAEEMRVTEALLAAS